MITDVRVEATPSWLDRIFLGEVLALLLAAPLLYFPNRFPVWGPLVGLLLLLAGWAWRKRQLGYWWMHLPVDLPLVLLLLLLPMSMWVAPAALRAAYSYPRSLILVWNMALFYLIVAHSGRSARLRILLAGSFVVLGFIIAVAALFGTAWLGKFPLLPDLLDRLPRFFVGTLPVLKAASVQTRWPAHCYMSCLLRWLGCCPICVDTTCAVAGC
jgi:hypothetical protein